MSHNFENLLRSKKCSKLCDKFFQTSPEPDNIGLYGFLKSRMFLDGFAELCFGLILLGLRVKYPGVLKESILKFEGWLIDNLATGVLTRILEQQSYFIDYPGRGLCFPIVFLL